MAKKHDIIASVPKSRITQSTISDLHKPLQHNIDNPGFSFGFVLQKYRKKRKISQTKLAEIMGTTRNTITNWETNKSYPEVNTIRELVQLLDIPLNELFGVGDSILPSASERILLERYRRLSPLGQTMLSDITLTMVAAEEEDRCCYLKDKFGVFKVPAITTAGSDRQSADIKPGYLFIKKNRLNTMADSVVSISGQSMEPYYYDGDLLYIKHQPSSEDGLVVICATPDGVVVNRILSNKLCPLNTTHFLKMSMKMDILY